MSNDPRRVIERYTDAYNQCDSATIAACLPAVQRRIGVGVSADMTREQNMARVVAVLERRPAFVNHLLTVQGEYVTAAWTASFDAPDSGAREEMSSIEVFRVVDGVITEVWNAPIGPGGWR